MAVRIVEESAASLAYYASVPSTFTVTEVLDVVTASDGMEGFRLVPRVLDAPYEKDYDTPADQHPSRWGDRFDITRWGFLAAKLGEIIVGRAAVVWDTPGVDMLERREDLSVLWDIRVAREARRKGVGAALFKASEEWARRQGALWLKIETQNVNVPACRFYIRQGCMLGAIHRFAYPELPSETQLLWYKRLA